MKGKKIISIGGPGEWVTVSKAGATPVDLAKKRWNLDIKTVSYSEFEKRMKKVKKDDSSLKGAQQQAEEYLGQEGISLQTDKKFVVNAFLLYNVFKDLMKEYEAGAITIAECLTTILPIAETTPCLPLSLLNDEGLLAFCESDFAVIPAGILLHYVSSKPVFLCNPTIPHDGVVTPAHCTAPRKMDGSNYETAKIMTHFESDYGAAPKVEMRKGQKVTVINPDFNEEKWMGFKGEIMGCPSYPMCRTQVNIKIEGDWKRLMEEKVGYHFMLAYGDYLDEIGYALKKVGIEWIRI